MVLDAIKNRCCVRSYSDKAPTDEQINSILEAARLAPSWGNVQSWKFLVIKDKETRELLKNLSGGQPHVAQAPVVIACIGDLTAWEKTKFKKILLSRSGADEARIDSLLDNPAFNPTLKDNNAVLLRTVEQVTYAVSYMTIETYNQGLSACIIGLFGNELTGVQQDVYEKLKKQLNIPDDHILITLLTVGYPSDDFKCPPKSRKDFSEVVKFDKFS